jgi:cupin 2 domain-containing protein
MINFLDIPQLTNANEIFTNILTKDNIRIEKITSYGQTTAIDKPYIQNHDEWVLVLSGKAGLKLGDNEHILKAGEYLFIPKNIEHWVTYTANPTIWLAVHIGE